MPAFYRKLAIITGDQSAIHSQLEILTKTYTADWITISDDAFLNHLSTQNITQTKAKLLLGQEFTHAIFDARASFNLDALAILTGTLTANSVLILIIPYDVTLWKDADSLRWSGESEPIYVPLFNFHFNNVIQNQLSTFSLFTLQLKLNQSQASNFLVNKLALFFERSLNHKQINTENQQNVLNKITQNKNKITLILSKRGRGKSALAGMYLTKKSAIVTSPNKKSISTLLKFAPKNTIFYAPDELILLIAQNKIEQTNLVIDEAAMIPIAILKQLITYFKTILITSTVDGYEGTANGLLLKLLADYKKNNLVDIYELHQPMRWSQDDPLEIFIENLTIADKNIFINKADYLKPETIILKQAESSLADRIAIFTLLKSAHYKTTLNDFRRLLDATDTITLCEKNSEQVISALIAIKEGGLLRELSENIQKGYRRPKGNLVAQSLTAHAFAKEAALLKSLRINRIATHDFYQNQGIATKLIEKIVQEAKNQHYDFVSVSFAYDMNLLNFWTRRGFSLVHVSHHTDSSSGNYAVMAIYALNDNGAILTKNLTTRLARNWFYDKNYKQITLPINEINNALNQTDLQELELFATSQYAFMPTLGALHRLVQSSQHKSYQKLIPITHYFITHDRDAEKAKRHFKLISKKVMIQKIRQEVTAFLLSINQNEGKL